MGLDMYVFATKETLSQQVDFCEPKLKDELYYWRKHPDLHGWMEKLYLRKGGRNAEFNLSGVVLDGSDLDQLEVEILGDRLPETIGCFFGVSDGSELDDDLKFITKARAAIAAGNTIFYVAWW